MFFNILNEFVKNSNIKYGSEYLYLSIKKLNIKQIILNNKEKKVLRVFEIQYYSAKK